jgi:(p)ppGpp synthase/HD superfamily hydrolase
MKVQQIDFDEVYDLIAFRVILDTDRDRNAMRP